MIAQLWFRGSMKMFENSAKLPHIAKDCLLIGQQGQTCTRITWLFGRLFVVTMPKMAKYTGIWLLTAPRDHIQSETLFQTRQDQERGIKGTASLLHS